MNNTHPSLDRSTSVPTRQLIPAANVRKAFVRTMKRAFFAVVKRLLLQNPEPTRLTEQEVLAIAKTVVTEEGWPWEEPVVAALSKQSRKDVQWEVLTNAHYRGGNPIIRIDDATGAVLGKSFVPR